MVQCKSCPLLLHWLSYGITATRRFFRITTGARISLWPTGHGRDCFANTGSGSLGAFATAFATALVFRGVR